MNDLQSIAAVVGAVAGVAALVGGAAIWVFVRGRRFESISRQLDSRFESTSKQLESLLHQGNVHLEITGLLVQKASLSDDDRAEIMRHYTAMAKLPGAPANPLHDEDQARLDRYVSMARAAEPFTPQQVEDYRRITEKLREEHPSDETLWPLLGLGALLVGLYLLGKNRDDA